MRIIKTKPNPDKWPDHEIWDHIWTYDEIHDLARADPDHSTFDVEWDDEEGGNFVDDHIDGWLDYISGQIEYFGLVFDNDKRTVTFSITNYKPRWSVDHQFEGINAVFDLIDKSYEHSGPHMYEPRGWGPMLPDMSGDDSVDYQSSLPSTVTQFIHTLLQREYPNGG